MGHRGFWPDFLVSLHGKILIRKFLDQGDILRVQTLNRRFRDEFQGDRLHINFGLAKIVPDRLLKLVKRWRRLSAKLHAVYQFNALLSIHEVRRHQFQQPPQSI